jgi:hypothetical protein
LLANCDRHAPGAPITITAQWQGESVVVEVRDEGPGLPPGREHAVLERGCGTSRAGGTGLGLHISQQLVAREGGTLTLRTAESPHGCVATVTVPAAPASSSPSHRRTGPSTVPAAGDPSVHPDCGCPVRPRGCTLVYDGSWSRGSREKADDMSGTELERGVTGGSRVAWTRPGSPSSRRRMACPRSPPASTSCSSPSPSSTRVPAGTGVPRTSTSGRARTAVSADRAVRRSARPAADCGDGCGAHVHADPTVTCTPDLRGWVSIEVQHC